MEPMKVEVRATGLRARRDAMGWTQRELAKRLEVTQNYIPAMELGNRNPSADLRQKMMKLFKCDFEDLFTVVMVNPRTKREDVLVRETRTA
jgi:transcriptional regulator with XRE-family HTH domain